MQTILEHTHVLQSFVVLLGGITTCPNNLSFNFIPISYILDLVKISVSYDKLWFCAPEDQKVCR